MLQPSQQRAEKKLEKVIAGEPERMGCRYKDVIATNAGTEEDPVDSHSRVV